MKVSEWLSGLNSHTIYDAKTLADDFKKNTGQQPCWWTPTAAEVRRMIKQRGIGGICRGNAPCANGYDVAAALAERFAGHHSRMQGRGFLFFDCLEALQKAGK